MEEIKIDDIRVNIPFNNGHFTLVEGKAGTRILVVSENGQLKTFRLGRLDYWKMRAKRIFGIKKHTRI